jgi:hypothetical protein
MTKIDPAQIDHVRGDDTGLMIPAHIEALRAGGVEFLTEAFRAFGSISQDNRVTRITQFEKCDGGSTGQKLFLSVEYAKPEPSLHTDLFVKFSRDFSNPARDNQGKYEMESEIRFGALSRLPDFPINVPRAYFADFHHESYTGVLITHRIAYGVGGIEPHRVKCRDHTMAEPIVYYRVIVKALARIAAAHKAGRLSADIETRFPYDPKAAAANHPLRYDSEKLRQLVADYAAFCEKCPQLLPDNIRSAAFIARLDRDAPRFLEHQPAIKRFLHSNRDFIALCHWNANIDNAWFWRDGTGELQCGLIDWGHVGQMNLAFPIWGCLSGANYKMCDTHLEELLSLFTNEIQAHGGPRLDVAELKLHLHLYMATMCISYFIESPARLLARFPEAADAANAYDPIFDKSETARNQINMMTVCLNMWERDDFGASLNQVLKRAL